MSLADALVYLRPGIDLAATLIGDRNGVAVIERWADPRPQPTPAEIDAAALPAAKARRIADINAECRARLIARFGPVEEQVSRSIGVYGATEQSAMQAGIAATIDASNTASNAVLAATDIAAVEAVSASWPVI